MHAIHSRLLWRRQIRPYNGLPDERHAAGQQQSEMSPPLMLMAELAVSAVAPFAAFRWPAQMQYRFVLADVPAQIAAPLGLVHQPLGGGNALFWFPCRVGSLLSTSGSISRSTPVAGKQRRLCL